MVDSTRRPWEPNSNLINGVTEYLLMRKEGLIQMVVPIPTVNELKRRALNAARISRILLELLISDQLHSNPK